jgi:hypothetical protein
MFRMVPSSWRRLRRPVGLGLVSLLAVLGIAGRAQAAASGYILTSEELVATYHQFLEVVTVQQLPRTDAQWGEVARYRVTSPGSSPVDLILSASILPSVSEAQRFFRDTAQSMESDNEVTTASDLSPSDSTGADEARSFRLIFTGDQSGQRVSDYAQLLRFGRAVALVEALGSPEADDHGVVDNDRALGMVRIAELVAGKMLYSPADPPEPVAAFGDFTGEWRRHGWGLQLDSMGHGDAHWRVYTWCSDAPAPPCDRLVGHTIESGGLASVIFYRVDGQTTLGVVLGSSDPKTLHVGAVSLTLGSDGLAQLKQGDHSITLCGPAFAQLAPASLQATAPCGA